MITKGYPPFSGGKVFAITGQVQGIRLTGTGGGDFALTPSWRLGHYRYTEVHPEDLRDLAR